MPLHCCSTASDDADQQDPEHPGLQQVPETHALDLLGGQRVLDVAHFGVGVVLRRRSGPESRRARSAMPFFTSQRGLSGTKQRAEEKQQRGHGHGREHPAPAVLAVPRLADELRRGAVGHLAAAISQLTICAPRMPMTIVNWLMATSRPRMCAGRHLGDVHRREVRGHADGHAAEDAPDDEPEERRRPTGQHARRPRTAAAAASSSFLRPNLSLRPPASSDPSRQPSRAQLLAQPLRSPLSS